MWLEVSGRGTRGGGTAMPVLYLILIYECWPRANFGMASGGAGSVPSQYITRTDELNFRTPSPYIIIYYIVYKCIFFYFFLQKTRLFTASLFRQHRNNNNDNNIIRYHNNIIHDAALSNPHRKSNPNNITGVCNIIVIHTNEASAVL